MKKILLALFPLFLFASVSTSTVFAEDKRPEVGPMVDAFQGPKSEQVWIARIGPKTANEVIMQITGIDHDLNKKIVKCSIETTNSDKRYTTQISGQPYVILILHGETSGELYLPGEKNTVRVGYNRELSAQGNPEAFLTDYLEQQKKK